MVKVDMASPLQIGAQRGALERVDDEFLQRDDRAMRQQNANATNRHDERATARTADANDRLLTPALIEACRLLRAEFSSQKSARDLSLIHI